jgi:hypothetical protein
VDVELAQWIRAELAERGFVVVPRERNPLADWPEPWDAVQRVLGERPLMAERQPIQARPGGRSFASSQEVAPLHSDSQDFLGASPTTQLMHCERASDEGGESVLLDTWAFAAELERREPELFASLFRVRRRFPFVFGEVEAPTLSLRGGQLTFTHAPRLAPGDALGAALQRQLDAAPKLALKVREGELLVVDNLRVLHGRRAFADPKRRFTRILAWMPRPHGANAALQALAEKHGGAVGVELPRALRIVLEMLTGVPPGVLAAREGVPEPELYRWRSRALEAAARALGGAR